MLFNTFVLDQGKLYSYGYGEYGTLGLGGLCFSPVPKLIKSLSDRVIIQIACGESHSLALTGKIRKEIKQEINIL